MRRSLIVIAAVAGLGSIGPMPAVAAPPEPPPSTPEWPDDALVIRYTFADLWVGGDHGGSYSLTVARVGAEPPVAELARRDKDPDDPDVETVALDAAVFDEVFARVVAADLGGVEDPQCTDSPIHRLTVSFAGSTVAEVTVTDCGDVSDDGIELLRSIIEPAADALEG